MFYYDVMISHRVATPTPPTSPTAKSPHPSVPPHYTHTDPRSSITVFSLTNPLPEREDGEERGETTYSVVALDNTPSSPTTVGEVKGHESAHSLNDTLTSTGKDRETD